MLLQSYCSCSYKEQLWKLVVCQSQLKITSKVKNEHIYEFWLHLQFIFKVNYFSEIYNLIWVIGAMKHFQNLASQRKMWSMRMFQQPVLQPSQHPLDLSICVCKIQLQVQIISHFPTCSESYSPFTPETCKVNSAADEKQKPTGSHHRPLGKVGYKTEQYTEEVSGRVSGVRELARGQVSSRENGARIVLPCRGREHLA